MLYNIEPYLWQNYGRMMSEQAPQKLVSLTIHLTGELSNGIECLARFASRRDAVQCLVNAHLCLNSTAA
jgi:hypothetical protein